MTKYKLSLLCILLAHRSENAFHYLHNLSFPDKFSILLQMSSIGITVINIILFKAYLFPFTYNKYPLNLYTKRNFYIQIRF